MKDSIYQTKQAKKQKEYDEDPFKRLSDELIISLIFDKISEAKSLCRCSLVSKHFSSLVFQSHNVSIKIPPLISNQIPNFSRDLPHHFSLAEKVIHMVTISLTGFIQASSAAYESKFVTFLGKFKSMKSLYVEYESSGGLIDSKNKPIVKWKLHLKSAKYILLVAPGTSADHVATDEFDCHVAGGICRCLLVEGLVPLLPESLLQVVITDSKKQGEIYLGESELLELRINQRRNANVEDGKESSNITSTSLTPQLISFNSVMKTVTLLVGEDKEGYFGNDYLRVKDAFVGEDEVLIEAVVEMLEEVRASL